MIKEKTNIENFISILNPEKEEKKQSKFMNFIHRHSTMSKIGVFIIALASGMVISKFVATQTSELVTHTSELVISNIHSSHNVSSQNSNFSPLDKKIFFVYTVNDTFNKLRDQGYSWDKKIKQTLCQNTKSCSIELNDVNVFEYNNNVSVDGNMLDKKSNLGSIDKSGNKNNTLHFKMSYDISAKDVLSNPDKYISLNGKIYLSPN